MSSGGCRDFLFFWVMNVLYCPRDKLFFTYGKSLGGLVFHVSRISPLSRELVQWIF